MNRLIALTALLLGTGAWAGTPAPAVKARLVELRGAARDDKRRLKQTALDQHKELVLLREREKSDALAVKASAANPETIHLGLLEVHEKSRRLRLALRARCREDRSRLRQDIKNRRAEISALRQKK